MTRILSYIVLVFQFIVKEIVLSFHFVKTDLYTVYLFPATALGTIPIINFENLKSMGILLILSCINGYLYLYIHDAANQDIGLEEDKINKPERPYPTKMADINYAKLRVGIVIIMYLLFSYFTGVYLVAMGWTILVLWYNYCGGHKNEHIRHLYVIFGIIPLFYTPWLYSGQNLRSAHIWLPIVNLVGTMGTLLQDFRDMEGDPKVKRKTYPIIWGEYYRQFMSILILVSILPIVFTYFYFLGNNYDFWNVMYWSIYTCIGIGITCCLKYKRGYYWDNIMYQLYCYQTGMVLVAPGMNNLRMFNLS